MFGTYCFISKRWIRGTIILGFFVAFFACGIIFPLGNIDTGISTHWLRARFNQQDLPFPPDILGLVAVILWIWDWFAVLFGWYKYPVIIKTEQNG
jgi:hypothetical protein